MTSKKFNVTQVKLPPRPRSERGRAGGGVFGGSTVIIGGSQSGGGAPEPHASTHSKGGSDPLRPHDIGAATSEHLHDDKYHPLRGSADLPLVASEVGVTGSAEIGEELIVGEAVTSAVLRSPNHDGLDRRGYVVEEIGETGQYAIRIHSAEIFGELVVNVMTVSEQRAVIGAVVNTCAGCEISMVEELSDRYRCFYQSKFGQWWMVGDQPECKRMVSGGSVSNYYWRLVVAVGSEQVEGEQFFWFDMSKSVAVGSGVPAKGDQVANCGHRGADARRKNYIITSAWGDSPYTAIYKGIDDFSLEGKRVKYESAELVEIASDVFRLTSPDGRTATPPVQVRADGDWSAARVPYFYYQQVMHRGFAWLCIDKSSTGTGVEPSPSAHNSWICTSKNYDGELADVRAVLDGVAAESSANAQRLVAMSSDGILSSEEKVAARSMWQQIQLSYTKLVGLATTSGVSYAALTTARNALEGLFITVQLSSDTDWVYPAMGQAGSKMDYDTKLSNWDFEISKLSRDISKSHVDAIEIGGVNLLCDTLNPSDKFWTYNGQFALWTQNITLNPSKQYTISGNYNEFNRVNIYNGDTFIGSIGSPLPSPHTFGKATRAEFIFASLNEITPRKPKIEVGNKVTDWSANPQDYPDSVQIGGVNLLDDVTKGEWNGWAYVRNFVIDPTQTYTVQGNFNIGCYVLLYRNDMQVKEILTSTKGYTFNNIDTITLVRTSVSYTIASFKIKLEKGNKATDWSPAPEDVQNTIQQGDNALSKIFGGGASPKSLLDFLGDNLDEKSFSVQKMIKHPVTGVSTPIMAVNNLAAYNLAVDNAFLNYLEAQKINVTKGGEDRIQIRAGSGSGDGISMFVGNVLKMSFTPALIPPLSALLNPIGGTSVVVNLHTSASAYYDQDIADSKESASIYINDNLTYAVTTPSINYRVSAFNPRGFARAAVTAYLRNKTTGKNVAILGAASSPFSGISDGVIPSLTLTIAQSGEYVIYVMATATAQDTQSPSNPEVRASSDAFISNGTFSILRTNTVSYQYSNGLFLIYDSANYDYTNIGGVSEYRRGNYIERLDSAGRRKSTNAGINWVNM